MKLRNSLAALAAMGLVAAPAVQAQSVDRAVAPTHGESDQFGTSYIIPVIIVIALGVGLYFALDDGDDDQAVSP
tara:strand:+ start:451 stop:672 length:222 start_codon:yes stop_codon:yes gene_type:complete